MRNASIYLLAFGLLLLGGLAIYPRAITGDFAKVTFDRIGITNDGRVHFSYSGTCTSGHCVASSYFENGRHSYGGGGISGSIGLGYPSAFEVGSDTFSPSRVADLRGQLRVKEGVEYIITSERPLVLFDLPAEADRHSKGVLSIAQQDSLRF